MVSQVIREKFTRRFETLDVDGDGVLRRADYEAYVERIASAAGRATDSPVVARLRDRYLALWADLVRDAGRSEFTCEQYVEALNASRGSADDPFQHLVSSLIEVFDTNEDGQLDGEEFARWMIAYGVTAEQAAVAFQQLDRNDDRILSVQELTSAFHEFYVSEDPRSVGNWLLGALPMHAS